MDATRRRFFPTRPGAAFALGASLLLSGLAVQASGWMPGPPMEPRGFPSYAACKAHLEQRSQEDRARADPQPRPVQAGGTVQTVVVTDGVLEPGRRHARYKVQIGWAGRGSERDAIDGMIQTQYSYEDTLLECKGRTLTGETASGYHLPGFERIAPEAAPAPASTPAARPADAAPADRVDPAHAPNPPASRSSARYGPARIDRPSPGRLELRPSPE